MCREIMQIARNYIRISRNLAVHGRRSYPLVVLRLIASRLIYGMGPDVFDRRRFLDKDLAQTLEYMPPRERENLQKSLCAEEARGMVENKLRFFEECRSRGLPTPTVHGVFQIRDTYLPQGMPVVQSRQELRKFLHSLPSGRYVVKPVDGAHGWGVYAFDVGNGELRCLKGKSFDPDRIYRKIAEDRHGSVAYMVQEFVLPHKQLRPIMPGPGLGTFRIVTILMGERSVEIPFSVVKIPVGASVTDNFDAGYSGNWVCPVDVHTGHLGKAVGKSPSVPIFSEIEKRLDTGATFNEVRVPLWEQVTAAVTEAALAFSELRTLGWDVAVTDEGPSLLEANWDWGVNIIEVAHNRGLRSELTELTRRSLSPVRV